MPPEHRPGRMREARPVVPLSSAHHPATPRDHRAFGHVQVRRLLRMLAVPSAVSVAMVLARFAYVADLRFRFCGLLWNLLLAWIPLALAWVLWRLGPARPFLAAPIFLAWLLFFPNTFYLITDLIHDGKFGMDGVNRWYDIFMTACFAVSGMFLGSGSLYLLHRRVRERWGRAAGWRFAGAVLAVSAYGTYLGRVLRLNSWDALVRPCALVRTILAGPGSLAEVALFCGGFFLFSAIVYWFIVSAVQLHEPSRPGARESLSR